MRHAFVLVLKMLEKLIIERRKGERKKKSPKTTLFWMRHLFCKSCIVD